MERVRFGQIVNSWGQTSLIPGLLPRFKVGNTQKLAVDELPTKLTAFNYEFEVETEIVGGTTSQEGRREGLLVLEGVLEECAKNNSFGIVLQFQNLNFVYCISFDGNLKTTFAKNILVLEENVAEW